MKKFLCFLLCAVMLFTSVTVFADNESPFVLEVTPSDTNEAVLSSSNTSKLSIKIVGRNGEKFGKNIIIKEIVYGSNGKNLLDKNETVKLNGDENVFTVCEDKDIVFASNVSSGDTVEFTAKWYFEGSSDSDLRVERTKITLVDPSPNVTVKVEPDKTSVAPGAEIKLTYEVHNSGNVPIKNIFVSDKEVASLLGKSYIYSSAKNFSLGVGESIVFTQKVTSNERLTLSPVVEYNYGNKSYTKKGSSSTVSVDDAVPYVSLECSSYSVSKSGEEVTFTYRVRNESKTALKNVKIYDSDSSDATVVNGPLSLEPGNECSGTYTLKINKSGFYKIKVVYSYDGSDGEKEISAKTEKAIRLPDEVKVNIVSISPETLTAAGVINFKLKVENTAVSDIKDVYISEENNLTQRTLVAENISNSSSAVEKEVSVNVPEDGTEIKFLLTYTLDGEIYSTSLLYRVIFGEPLETPVATQEATPSPTATASSSNSGLKGSLIWIIFGVFLLALIGCAIFLLIRVKKNEETSSSGIVYRKTDANFEDGNDDGYYDSEDGNYGNDGEYSDEFTDRYSDDTDDEIDEEGVKIYRKP